MKDTMQKEEFFHSACTLAANSGTSTKDELIKEFHGSSPLRETVQEETLLQSGREILAQANGTVLPSVLEERWVEDKEEYPTYEEDDIEDQGTNDYEPVATPDQIILSQLMGLQRSKELKADLIETRTVLTDKPSPDFVLRNQNGKNLLALRVEQDHVLAISTDPEGKPIPQIFIGEEIAPDGKAHTTGTWKTSSQMGLNEEAEIENVELFLATMNCLDMAHDSSTKSLEDLL